MQGQAQVPLGMDPRYNANAGPVGYGGWKAKKYEAVDNVIQKDGVQVRWSDHLAVRVTIERI